MPRHDEFGIEKANNRHVSLDPVTRAMEAEARAQAASLPPTGKPVAPPATNVPQRAQAAGQIRLG